MDTEEIFRAMQQIEGRLETLEEFTANMECVLISAVPSEARRVCEEELGKLREEIDLD